MARTAEQVGQRVADGFRHEALLYAGEDGFVEATLPWIRDAVAADEPILVVVGAAKIARLRRELGPDAERVAFADMADVGANPARIIPAWRDFVDAHAGPGRRLRGIGEPISPQRSADELVECQRHEALLNLAFAGAEDFWLLCPYDVDALDPDVIAKAHHSHPDRGRRRRAARERRLRGPRDGRRARSPSSCPRRRPTPTSWPSPRATLGALRRLVSRRARDAGLAGERADDLVLAVNEVATNSIRHGGGRGVMRVWRARDTLVFEVADGGRIADPLVGPPSVPRAASRAVAACGCATRSATSSSCAPSPAAASCACTRAWAT